MKTCNFPCKENLKLPAQYTKASITSFTARTTPLSKEPRCNLAMREIKTCLPVNLPIWSWRRGIKVGKRTDRYKMEVSLERRHKTNRAFTVFFWTVQSGPYLIMFSRYSYLHTSLCVCINWYFTVFTLNKFNWFFT